MERELKLTRSAVVALSAAATLATDGSGRLDVAAGVTRSDVVEGVEGIHAELDGHVLPNSECLGEAEIGPEEPRATIGVDAGVAEVVEPGSTKVRVPDGVVQLVSVLPSEAAHLFGIEGARPVPLPLGT